MRTGGFFSLLGAVFILAACNPTAPSQVQTGKIQVKEQMVAETLDARRVDAGRVNVIADNFIRNGRGSMTLTVSHASGDKAKTTAESRGEAYRKEMEKRGVSGISVVTVPVADAQYADRVIVTYKALTAEKPEGCRKIPGYQGAESLDDGIKQYQFGCEIQTNISKMISDPSDLLGKAGTPDGDSRRNGTIIEPYRAGTPNQKIQGMQASRVGN